MRIEFDLNVKRIDVSIHASVMDAKVPKSTLSLRVSFNPRIRDGCEIRLDGISASLFCFNPRIRDGCEANWQSGAITFAVSIHASVMDAKRYNRHYWSIGEFQSTHP